MRIEREKGRNKELFRNITLDDWIKDELLIETGNKGGKADFWSL